MPKNNNNLRENKQTAKIVGIQFSILSPEEIRRASVAEITSRDTYEITSQKSEDFLILVWVYWNQD